MTETKNSTTPIVVYAEQTPNPSAIKFVVNIPLLEGGIQLEFPDVSFTKGAPLAKQLFQFPFIKNIFISGNYITLTKADQIEWADVMNEIRDFIKNYFTNNGQVLDEVPSITSNAATLPSSVIKSEIITEIDMRIVDILNEYIKPAVEQDGGAITFKSFNNGIVTVALQGSCSGCPSSQMTLKAGIEGLLKRMVPEVNELVAQAY